MHQKEGATFSVTSPPSLEPFSAKDVETAVELEEDALETREQEGMQNKR